MKDLTQCRAQLDAIDAQLVALFEQRMRVSRDVAAVKHEKHLNIFDPAREEAVLESRAQMTGEEAFKPAVVELFQEIMRLSRQEQRRYLDELSQGTRVAYMGIPGAFSESATLAFFPNASERVCCKTFEEVFAAVASGAVKYGVLPVENSSSGSISSVYDLLRDSSCHIVGEQLMRVEHCLLGLPGATLDDIKTVFSHEQGFAQCPDFLSAHPEWIQTPYFNTAIAAQHVAQLGRYENAAIASRLAAKHYGLSVIAPDIQSFDNNHTRFIVVSASPTPISVPDKATLTFTLRHERGTLMRALSSFVALGMNLTHIESRPLKRSQWEYCFYVDLCGNISDEALDVLMQSLEKDCEDCRLLGAYRAARE